jgi:cell wall-associated NlpC family hydrolase
MDRLSHFRSLRLWGAAIALSACLVLACERPASADPTLDQTQQHYREVREQVRELDARAERLTEQYNAAVEELKRLDAEIKDAKRRLRAEQIKLHQHEDALEALMVLAYKGFNSKPVDIVLGAESLDDVTSGLDVQERYDRAVADAVQGIRQARDAIQAEKLALEQARVEAERQRQILEDRRKQIVKELHQRRRLMAELGVQVEAGLAADRIGQAALATRAAAWILADRRANRGKPAAQLRDTVALEGLKQIGVPYKWGGASPEGGFDCSGLMMWLWAQHDWAIPHFAASQYAMGPVLDPSAELEIGDLVFFHDLGHVGMYIGHGMVLHAPHTGDFVRIAPFDTPWFQATYVGATRPGPSL